ncbi:N-acetyltransferase domain-containing protein [Aphelenchoides besseyi]|nr:N-acetyltransferase domain-containing protein [Aphelenchoides besseyi]
MSQTGQFRIINWGSATITADLLEKCAKLFSENYGKWGVMGLSPGSPVKLLHSRLRSDYLFNPQTCSLITADTGVDGDVVAHAFVCSFPFLNGYAVWITQLVVRKDMRHKGLATELVARAWKKDAMAWGLMTSHPYSVRALESARQLKCDPQLISLYAKDLIKASGIPFFQECKISTAENRSVIHSKFFVDHTNVNAIVASLGSEWKLGALEEGDEFFAFTFKDHS